MIKIRHWKRLKYWQKGMIIGFIFVVIIYTPITLIFKDACKTVPCEEACALESPYINPEKCNFWHPIFLTLISIPLLPFLVVGLPIYYNLTYFFSSSFLYILYLFIGGYIIDKIKEKRTK